MEKIDMAKNYPWPSLEALMQLWNEEAGDVPIVRLITSARRTKAGRYLKEFPDREDWLMAFRAVRKSKFLQGLSSRTAMVSDGRGHVYQSNAPTWKGATFDWFFQKGKYDQVENIAKVLEGRYDE